MEQRIYKTIIIGAGLSGLTTAFELQNQGEKDFIILEGRDRVGGRVFTSKGIDLGATWFNSQHQHLNSLLAQLQVRKFVQYSKGKSQLIYNSMAPAHYFESETAENPAFRIAGGTQALISSLAKKVQGKIKLSTRVQAIIENEGSLQIRTENGDYVGEKVVVTLPPKLANRLEYLPELPGELEATLQKTHTWMSNAIKVGLSYDAPFWREKGLSGTLISQISPVIELYDHCDWQDQQFALMGFVNEGLRSASPEHRKARILAYLENCFGPEIQKYIGYQETDWSLDGFTSCPQLTSVYMSPQYGDPLFDCLYMGEKLLFSGTETSPLYGGYLEGAVYSGISAAKKLIAS